MNPLVKAFFHQPSYTVTYVVADGKSGKCSIIDSVLDYEANSGRSSTKAADEVIEYIKAENLTVAWILETHVHADHLTAAPYLQKELGGQIGIGGKVAVVQDVFSGVFNTGAEMPVDGSQFDKLLQDGEKLECGGLQIEAISTPGHTPACMTYVIGDAVFIGDTMFMPDFGTARCDFPGGDASQLYTSIQKILSMPDNTRLFMCHDYAPNGREYEWETTVAAQKAANIHVKDGISEGQFVEMRNSRDAELDMPGLILPSVQINMRAGHFPEPEDNGMRYLKIPLNEL